MKKTVSHYLIGIDEAGRGPLAGPVAVGAFSIRSKDILKKFHGVKDSKQLSEKQREEWFTRISKEANPPSHLPSVELRKARKQKRNVYYTVSFASPKTIDTKGLSHAIYSALNRCLRRLELNSSISSDSKILLDGSLYASSRYSDQTTIIDGDSKEQIIALASICAKVLRDRRMKKFAKEYPEYGFEVHKGYGTKAHYKAIRKHGLSAIHRKSFCKGVRWICFHTKSRTISDAIASLSMKLPADEYEDIFIGFL